MVRRVLAVRIDEHVDVGQDQSVPSITSSIAAESSKSIPGRNPLPPLVVSRTRARGSARVALRASRSRRDSSMMAVRVMPDRAASRLVSRRSASPSRIVVLMTHISIQRKASICHRPEHAPSLVSLSRRKPYPRVGAGAPGPRPRAARGVGPSLGSRSPTASPGTMRPVRAAFDAVLHAWRHAVSCPISLRSNVVRARERSNGPMQGAFMTTRGVRPGQLESQALHAPATSHAGTPFRAPPDGPGRPGPGRRAVTILRECRTGGKGTVA